MVYIPSKNATNVIPAPYISLFKNTTYIPLTQGKVAVVSLSDYPYLSQFRWYTVKTKFGYCYARRRDTDKKFIYMARDIMRNELEKSPLRLEVGHINGSTLDNCRENLRLSTSSQIKVGQKGHSDSLCGVKGVCLSRNRKKFIVRIRNQRKTVFLATKSTIQDADWCYRVNELILFNDYARESTKELFNSMCT